MDSSSETSPSAPSISLTSDSQTIITAQPHSLTRVTPSKDQYHIFSTIFNSYSFGTHTQSRNCCKICKPQTTYRNKNSLSPTPLNIVQIPDTEYSALPSLHLPSELNPSNTSKTDLHLKPFRKQSASLSNILDISLEYIPQSQDSFSSFYPPHRYYPRPLPSRRLSTNTSTPNFSFFRVTLHYVSQGNTLNHCPLIHILQTLFHNRIIYLLLKPLLYFLLTYKPHIFQATYFLRFS